MEAVVDRIENDIIIIELTDRTKLKFSKELLPEAKEGDILTISVMNKKTEKRKKEMEERMNSLWKG